MYPVNGKISAQYGHVQGSRLAVSRFIFKMHRMGIMWGSHGTEGLCSKYPMPIMYKSQYRVQATNPIPSVSGKEACRPLGGHQLIGGGKMIPGIGEDMGFPRSTVQNRRTRALTRLADILTEGGDPHGKDKD